MIRRLFGAEPIPAPRLISGSGSGGPETAGFRQGSLRVLTWNVHKQTHPGFARDLDRLLDRHRPDILQFQEARIEALGAALARRPEGWHWLASPNLRLPGGESAGVVTALRASPTRGDARLSEACEPLLRSRKPMLLCEAPCAGARLLCLNIHSLNFRFGLAAFRAQLSALLDAARAHPGPVLLSGDFNTWSRGRMDLLAGLAGEAGLARIGFSGRRKALALPSLLELDHVFCSRTHFRVEPGAAEILADIRSSDHAPLLVDLAFTP